MRIQLKTERVKSAVRRRVRKMLKGLLAYSALISLVLQMVQMGIDLRKPDEPPASVPRLIYVKAGV